MPDRKSSLLDTLPVLDSSDKPSGTTSLLDKLPTIDEGGNDNTQPQQNLPKSAQTAANGIDAKVANDNLSYATGIMNQMTGFDAANEKPQANVVQFTATNDKGGQAQRTYAHVPGRGVAIQQSSKEGSDHSVPDKLQYQPQAGEAFRNGLTHENVSKAQAEVSNELNANAEYLQKDATNLLQSAPPIVQQALKNMGVNEDFPKRLANPNGDIDALKIYTQAKNAALQNSKENDIADLNIQYPVQSTGATNEFSTPLQRENEDQYNEQKSAIDKKYADEQEHLNSAAFNLAAVKSFNTELSKGANPEDVSPLTVGKSIQNAMGQELDPNDPTQKVETELLGYHAIDVMAKKAFADGDLDMFKALNERSQNAIQKVIDNNPDFRKQQVQKALADEIFKEGNSLLETAIGKDITAEDVKSAGEKLGLRPQDYEDIDPNDIKRWSGAINTGINSFLRSGLAPVIEAADRHILNPIMQVAGNGLNDQQLNETYNDNWWDKSSIGRFFKGQSPDAANITPNGSHVETNPISQNYLLNVSDANDNKWNLGVVPFLSTIANGAGQSASIVAGGELTGGLLKGAQLVTDAEKASRIGMNVFMAVTGWDRNYRYAAQSVGNKPGDEGKRVALAMIYNGAEVASENIIPEYQLFDKIRGTHAVSDFLKRVEKDGIQSIGKEGVAKAFKEGALEAGKNILGEGAEEVATDYGNMVGDMVFASDKYKKTDYNQQAFQDGIVGAVSAFLPVGAGSIREIAQQGPMAKSMLFEVGNNSQYYTEQFKKQIEDGTLSQKDGNHKISLVNTMAEIVKNSVPKVSPANNKDLTTKDQHDYANLRLQEELLKDQKTAVKDPVQEKYIDEQLANIDTKKDEILNTPDNSSQLNINNNGQSNEAQTETINGDQGQENGRQDVLNAPAQASDGNGEATNQTVAINDIIGQFEDEEANAIQSAPADNANTEESKAVAEHTQATTQPEIAQDIRPTAVDDGKKVDYTTDNGNQRVVYQNGGLKVLNAKGEEVSAPTKRKAIREAVDKYDFTQGELSSEIPADATTDEEVGRHIATASNSPVELVDLYHSQEPVAQALSAVESAIADLGAFTTTNQSYDRFGDRNNKNLGIGRNYLNNKTGTPIDEIARELSDHTGLDVQPKDIVDFIDRFPKGIQQATRTQESDVAIQAAARFEDITGFPLTKDIAEKVMQQQEEKLDKQFKEETDKIIQKDFENEQQLTKEFDRLVANGEITIPQADANDVPEESSATKLGNEQDETGAQQPRQESATSAATETLEPLSPEEQQMRDFISKIEDYKQRLEKSEESRDLMARQGKENTPEYKGKVKAAQQLRVKLKEVEKEYKVASAKVYAERIRNAKVKSIGNEESFAERNNIPEEEIHFNVKSDYYKQLDEALDELKNARRSVNRTERSKGKTAKNVNAFAQKLINGTTEEDVVEAKANLADAIKNYREEKNELRQGLPRERGANFVIEKLSNAARNENIPQQSADLAIDFMRANPDLFEDLAISITKAPEESGTHGFYSPEGRLVKIFKGSDALTATHELLHHTERYLPEDIRVGILNEWNDNVEKYKDQLRKNLKTALDTKEWDKNYKTLLYLEMAQKMQGEPRLTERKYLSNKMMDLLKEISSDKNYQYFNPSEWWAVNASKEFGKPKSKNIGWLAKAKEWYQKLINIAKNALGYNNTKAVSKGLNAVLAGNTQAKISGEMLAGSGVVYNVKTDSGVDPKIYNAALETAALAIEGGAHLANAIQSAIDYVNERVFTKWDEEKLRKTLGQGMAFPLTPEDLRNQKLNDTELSEKNRQLSDALVDKIKNNEASLKEVLDQINTSSLSPAIKAKVSQYINNSATENVFKLQGQENAEKYLSEYNNDFNSAREELGKAYDTATLNAQNESEKDNLRKNYVAGLAYLNAKETEQKVKDGEIKPVSTIQPNEENKNIFQLPKLNKLRKAEYEFTNKFARIRDAQRAAQEITKETDALSALRLAKPKAWDKINQIRKWLGSSDTIKGSLFDRMKKEGVDLREFNLFLYAQHAPERNAQNAAQRQRAFEGKVYDLQSKIADAKGEGTANNYQQQLSDILQQKNPNFVLMPDGGSGMTNQEAQDILHEVDLAGQTEQYQKFADEFREHVVQPILDFKYESGLIDEDQYNRIRSTYQNYVPLKFDIDEAKRLMDGTDGRTPEERAEDTKINTERKVGKDLYKSTGATDVKWTNRNSPVLQALSDLEHSILQGENNLANIRMANLVRENPNPEIWNVQPAKYDITKDKNGNVTFAKEIDAPKNGAPFWEDGKKSYLIFNDPGIKAAFEKAPDPNGLLRFGSALSNLYRTGATLRNPDFIVKNVIIDQQDAAAAISAEQNDKLTAAIKKNRGILGARLFKDAVPQLVKDEGEWADYRRKWSEAGGKVSFTKPLSLKEEAEQANKIYEAYGSSVTPHQLKKYIKSPITAIENFSEFLEEITRIMVFKSGIEAGLDSEKAALLSRDATIDFEKSGTKGAWLNAYKVFMNAALQGTINDATRFKKSPLFRKWAGAMALAGAGIGVLNTLMSDCDPPNNPDCWDEIPEYKKQRTFMVPMKAFGGKGYLTIPMGRQLGIFTYIGQLAQATSEYYNSKGEHGMEPSVAFKNLIEAGLNAYVPGGSEPVEQAVFGNIGWIIGQLENKNSFGSHIRPENHQNLPAHENAFKNTPEFWNSLANGISTIGGGGSGKNAKFEIFEWSPNTLQSIAQSLLTGYYSTGAKLANTAHELTSDDPLKAKDIPVVGSFVVRESSMSTTKDKKAQLVDKATKHELSDKEMKDLHDALDQLKEGGQDPDGKGKAATLRFVNKSQQQVKKNEIKGEHKNTSE